MLSNSGSVQPDQCIQDANASYRISLDPPAAEHADEHHDLTVVVDKPGVLVRTNTEYYDEPVN